MSWAHIRAMQAYCRETLAKAHGTDPPETPPGTDPPEAPPPVSALARWQAAKRAVNAEGWSHLGGNEEIERRFPGLTQAANLEINRGEGPVATQKGMTMTAKEEFTSLWKAYQQKHGGTDQQAMDHIAKDRPELWERGRKEGPTRVQVAKDIQQLDVPKQTEGEKRFEVLKQHVQAKHPEWPEGAVVEAVSLSADGKAAMAQHRRELLFGG
jgi:hypothetical protein